MSQFREGRQVQARVVGFLPGRKVVLDVDGDVTLAWSNVPLVRGMTIRAMVERPGDTLRLRILGESEEPVEEANLEALVRSTARMLGMRNEPALFRSVCEQLQQAVPELQRGPVALSEIQPWVQDILEAQARGLPGTRRAWGAVRIASEARLGTALARLRESLDVAAVHSRGQRRRRCFEWSARLQSFFLDLRAGPIASLLQEAIRQCGYLPSATTTASDPTSQDNLRQTLFALATFLGDFQGEPLEGQSIDFRRSLERSIVWCVQAMEILEGLQAQNSPAENEPTWSASLQIPVHDQQRHGTLFAILALEQSSLWLDVHGREPLSARLRHQNGCYKVDLYLPAGADATALQVDWCSDPRVELSVHEEVPASGFANVDLIV